MAKEEYTIEDFVAYGSKHWNTDPENTIKVLKTPIERYKIEDSNLMMCYYYLGLAFYKNDEFNVAVPCLNRTIELQKKIGYDNKLLIADAYFFLGMCYDRIDMVKEAIDSYNTALKYYISLDGNYKDIIIDCLYYIGSGYLYLGDDENVLRYFRKAIELIDDDIEEYALIYRECEMYMGVSFTNIGEYDRAELYLLDAMAYYQASQDEDALISLENIYYTLADCYKGMGKLINSHKYSKLAKELTAINEKRKSKQ